MNETKYGSASALAKEAVVVYEAVAVFGDFANEGIALLIMVMKMNLHVADAEANQFRYAVEQFAPILLLGVEEAVLRALAPGISGSVAGNPRPSVAPKSDAAERCLERSAHTQRFVVIGNGNPGALRLLGQRAAPKTILQIRA